MLPKKNRISRKDFPSHNTKGFRVFSPYFSAVFYKTEAKDCRASVVVSKKTSRTAVDRNTLRRRFYDLIASYFKETPSPITVVVYPKIEAKKITFLALKSEIERAFRQAKIIK